MNLGRRLGCSLCQLAHFVRDVGAGVLLGDESQARVVDFLPSDRARGYRTRRVGETTLVAMYQNNRAAEALVEGRLDEAYAWHQRYLKTGSMKVAVQEVCEV